MTAYGCMLRLLKQTGLYRLDGTTAVEKKLALFARYFDLLSELMDDLLKNCFVETITPAGFSHYRALYSLPDDMDWATMATLVSRRLALTNRDFTIDGVKRCLASGGFTVNLTEDFAANKVTVQVLTDVGAFSATEEKTAFIKSCLPCHVEPVIMFG